MKIHPTFIEKILNIPYVINDLTFGFVTSCTYVNNQLFGGIDLYRFRPNQKKTVSQSWVKSITGKDNHTET
jgi:hypothetical protein